MRLVTTLDKSQEFAVINELAANMKNGKIHVFVFRDQVEPVNSFEISNGSSVSVIRFLEQVEYDGKTW